MSDPLTIATIALTAANAVGQAKNAKVQGEESAELAEQQAQATQQATARRFEDLSRRNKSLLASRRVRYGKGGIVLSGTPLDLLADAAAENELALQDVVHEGEAVASGLKQRAGSARRRGRNAHNRGLLVAGTQLIGNVGPYLRKQAK